MSYVYIARISLHDEDIIKTVCCKSKENARELVENFYKNIHVYHITIESPIGVNGKEINGVYREGLDGYSLKKKKYPWFW